MYVIRLHPLNLRSAVCHLYLNKTGGELVLWQMYLHEVFQIFLYFHLICGICSDCTLTLLLSFLIFPLSFVSFFPIALLEVYHFYWSFAKKPQVFGFHLLFCFFHFQFHCILCLYYTFFYILGLSLLFFYQFVKVEV